MLLGALQFNVTPVEVTFVAVRLCGAPGSVVVMLTAYVLPAAMTSENMRINPPLKFTPPPDDVIQLPSPILSVTGPGLAEVPKRSLSTLPPPPAKNMRVTPKDE